MVVDGYKKCVDSFRTGKLHLSINESGPLYALEPVCITCYHDDAHSKSLLIN